MKTEKEKIEYLAKFHTVPVSIFTTDEHRTKQFECPKTAIKVFLKDYAFEKAGAAIAYKFMAAKAVEKTNIDFNNISDEMIRELWYNFSIQQKDNNGINFNGKSNPLCYDIFKKGPINPKGKYKIIKNGDVDYKKTILGVLRTLENTNIACYVKEMIKASKVNEAHKKLCDISGAKSKVISLYMRDIAYICSKDDEKYIVEPSYLLQPIDTWIAQTYKIIFDNTINIEDAVRNRIVRPNVQKNITKSCLDCSLSPIDFNKGAWYFGSQIAKTYNRLQTALEDTSKANEYIKEALAKLRNEKSELSKFLN